MTTDVTSNDLPQNSLQSDGSTIVVLISMFLVSASIAFGLILHLGLNSALAAVVGFSLFVGLTGFHLWQRSSSEAQALQDEIEFLEAEVDRLRTSSAVASFEAGSFVKTKDTPVQTSFLENKPVSAAPLPSSHVKENDVEMLQSRIKEMLTQVSAAEQARDETEATLRETEPVSQTSSSLEKALDSLRSAAQSLRPKIDKVSEPISSEVEIQSSQNQSSSVPDELVSSEPKEKSLEEPQVLLIQDAIGNGRVDVFLDPILSLGEHSAKHYEVSVSLKGPVGEELGPFNNGNNNSNNSHPLIDCVRLQRSVIVAERLATQGRKGSVFTQVRGDTLLDPNFNNLIQKDFSIQQSLFHQLVLSFTQSDIRKFRSAEQMAVTRLAGLGFHFAISDLGDLDMNFEAMSRAGFRHVKLKASVLSQGISYPQGQIQAREVTSYLTKYGFTLIVEDIDSEDMLARVYGYGVLFGQGSLFGGRRPVRADFMARPGQAAA